MSRLFQNRSTEVISPLIDVVMNGFGAMFIILMIYLAISRVGGPKPLRMLDGHEPPHGVVGASYLYVPPIVGGSGARTFTLLDGDIAAWGLTMDPRSGAIHGVPRPPAAPAEYPARLPIRLSVKDSTFAADSVVTLTMHSGAVPASEAPVKIARRNPALPSGRVGSPWECVIGDSRSTPDVTWNILQPLPPGIEIDRTTGRLYGTPEVGGTWQFALRCERAGGTFRYEGATHTWSADHEDIACTMTVLPALAPVLQLPPARAGEPWTGGVVLGTLLPEENISFTGLPPELTLIGTIITGRPRNPGRTTLVCAIRCGEREIGQASAELVVLPPRESARLGHAVFHVWAGQTAEFDVPCVGFTEPVTVEAMRECPAWTTFGGAKLTVRDANPGTYDLPVRARDVLGSEVAGSIRLTVSPKEPLRIPTPQLVPLIIGDDVSWRPLSAGGTGLHTWSMEPPDLPGFSLANGFLRGRASSKWTQRARARIVDPMSGETGEAEVVFRAVHPETRDLRLTTADLPPAILGREYRMSFSATGGVGDAAFEMVGNQPPGLVNTIYGLEGTPTELGRWTLTVRAKDEAGQETPRHEFTLFVRAEDGTKPRIISTSLPAAILGQHYSIAIACPGGVGIPKLSFDGSLPAGMNFTDIGIAGTPTAGGSFDIEARATDAIGQNATPQRLRLSVLGIDSSTPQVTTTDLQPARGGRPYTCHLAAEGGVGKYEWLVTGDLPLGLARTGALISGTLSNFRLNDTWPLRVQVRDEAGNLSPEVRLTLTVEE